ncbi:hypothetical protein NMY22_g13287 [Coprinellus aureogranulatus]|nr:hypothetical protein NMY22_g13287 [Coprinellus aureogranulatus]
MKYEPSFFDSDTPSSYSVLCLTPFTKAKLDTAKEQDTPVANRMLGSKSKGKPPSAPVKVNVKAASRYDGRNDEDEDDDDSDSSADIVSAVPLRRHQPQGELTTPYQLITGNEQFSRSAVPSPTPEPEEFVIPPGCTYWEIPSPPRPASDSSAARTRIKRPRKDRPNNVNGAVPAKRLRQSPQALAGIPLPPASHSLAAPLANNQSDAATTTTTAAYTGPSQIISHNGGRNVSTPPIESPAVMCWFDYDSDSGFGQIHCSDRANHRQHQHRTRCRLGGLFPEQWPQLGDAEE